MNIEYEYSLPPEYRNLMRAVFDAAARDYLGLVCRVYDGNSMKANHVAEIHDRARDWFLADNPDDGGPFTLHTICQVTGWNERAIKNGIIERERANARI